MTTSQAVCRLCAAGYPREVAPSKTVMHRDDCGTLWRCDDVDSWPPESHPVGPIIEPADAVPEAPIRADWKSDRVSVETAAHPPIARERRTYKDGLRDAADIAATMAERPYDNEPEFSAVLAVEAAIRAALERED